MVGFLPLRDANLRRVAAQRLVHLLRQERARALLVRGAVAALPKVDDVALAAVVGVAKHVRVARVKLSVLRLLDGDEFEIFHPPTLELARGVVHRVDRSIVVASFPRAVPRRERVDVHLASLARLSRFRRLRLRDRRRRSPSMKRLLEQRGFRHLLDHLDRRRAGQTVRREELGGALAPGEELVRARAFRGARLFPDPHVHRAARDQHEDVLRLEMLLRQRTSRHLRERERPRRAVVTQVVQPHGGGAERGGVGVFVGAAVLRRRDVSRRERRVVATQRVEKGARGVVQRRLLVHDRDGGCTAAFVVLDGEGDVERLGFFALGRSRAVPLREVRAVVEDEDIARVERGERDGHFHDADVTAALDVEETRDAGVAVDDVECGVDAAGEVPHAVGEELKKLVGLATLGLAELRGEIAEELVELDRQERGGASLVARGLGADPEVRVHVRGAAPLPGVEHDVAVARVELAGESVGLLHWAHLLDAPHLDAGLGARAGEELRGGHREERARSGGGTVEVEGAVSHPRSRNFPRQLSRAPRVRLRRRARDRARSWVATRTLSGSNVV